uniref:Putative secreted protein n=1 Tax=Anopheles triannulatus TaxID=58253 RepID=A0A2M4B0U7_9DIPT
MAAEAFSSASSSCCVMFSVSCCSFVTLSCSSTRTRSTSASLTYTVGIIEKNGINTPYKNLCKSYLMNFFAFKDIM